MMTTKPISVGTVFDAEFRERLLREPEAVRAMVRALGGTGVLPKVQIIDKATVRAGEFPVAAVVSPSDEG